MKLDALEAKLAGDFHDNGRSPVGQEDRGYKWVTSVLDNPVDDDSRGRVEGHKVQVKDLRINGLKLDGILVFGTVSSLSVPSVVIYTPQAPDGKCFRELSSIAEIQPLLVDSAWLEYLVNLAAPALQAQVRRKLTVDRAGIALDLQPLVGDIFQAAYEVQVERVLVQVDVQTQSTWERNWESAWEIASFVGETVLMFTPFKVALPIAGLRSLYAVAQGVRSAAKGEQKAALYFFEAALVLADGLPGGKVSRMKPRGTVTLALDPKKALSKAPEGLNLRTDGRFNGVYEVSREGAPSSFYVTQAKEAFAVRYDLDFATWRLVDPRRPSAYYQMPIIFKDGRWVHARLGLVGGGKSKKAPKKEEPGTSGGSGGQAGSARVFKLDLSDYSSEKLFTKREQGIREQLDESVAKIIKDFELDPGAHHFHPVEKIKREVVTESGRKEFVQEKLFTFDIPNMPSDKGRGAWRLKVREPYDRKGVVVFYEVMPSHKSKH